MAFYSDKTAIVTGGASGIGRALCKELGRQGAIVLVADIHSGGAEEVASAIVREKGRATAATVDTAEAAEVENLVDSAVAVHGRLDLMFNNAGIAIGGEFRDLRLEHWRRVLDVNLLGVLHGTMAAYSVMVEQGSGHIVNTASTGGLIGYPIMAPYITAKHAVVGLSNSLRVEAEALGVRVSVVCPGFIQTNIFDSAHVLNADGRELFAQVPFKMMDPQKAARVILKGVQRNKPIISFPFHAHLLWLLHRAHPALVAPLCRKMIREFRRIRRENCETVSA